jgi:outer membrane biosynthesis protein TonB
MKALLISIAVVISSSASFAQPVSSDNPNSATAQAPATKSASCESQKRTATREPLPDRPTVYSFTIKTDGSLADVVVKTSSGNTIVDQMGAECMVTHWHYKPGMKDGQPVETPWQAQIIWKAR